MYKSKVLDVELKRCPFCGGKAKLEMASRAFIHGVSCKTTYVHCMDCEARTSKFKLDEYEPRIAVRMRAIEAWNRRSDA